MSAFHTAALGGPIDLLGMNRSTALFDDPSSGVHSWQMVRLDRMCVENFARVNDIGIAFEGAVVAPTINAGVIARVEAMA
jgi:hypothetical protein